PGGSRPEARLPPTTCSRYLLRPPGASSRAVRSDRGHTIVQRPFCTCLTAMCAGGKLFWFGLNRSVPTKVVFTGFAFSQLHTFALSVLFAPATPAASVSQAVHDAAACESKTGYASFAALAPCPNCATICFAFVPSRL